MNRQCIECATELEYNEKWDTYYCPECNVWRESSCSDPDCQFCPKRPENPKQKKPVVK